MGPFIQTTSFVNVACHPHLRLVVILCCVHTHGQTCHNVQVNLGNTSDAVESVANVTDIHEAMFFHADDEVTRSNFGIWSLRWSPDGKEIIAGTGNSSLYIYDVESQRVRAFHSHPDVLSVSGNDAACDYKLLAWQLAN